MRMSRYVKVCRKGEAGTGWRGPPGIGNWEGSKEAWGGKVEENTIRTVTHQDRDYVAQEYDFTIP